MDFADTVCVVTGGANGIGRCIVEAFAAKGARVAFIDLAERAGVSLAKRLGPDTLFMPGDIADESTLNAFASGVTARFGRVDCLVNNACLSRRGILSGCGYDDFNYVLRVGVAAPYHLTRLLLPAFAPGASVVNIASTRAFMSQADTESYSAAKGGISALTHALAASLAGRARVNAVSPGWIETAAFHGEGGSAPEHSEADKRQHPAGRVGRPGDIAAAVLFLCSKEADFITGQNIVVDGGMTRQMIYHNDQGWRFAPQA